MARLLGELGYPCDASEAGSRIERALLAPASGVLVAADGSELLGLLSYEEMFYFPAGSTICRITALVVSPAARRKGIATSLVDRATQAAASRRCSAIEVTTASARDEAHRFYEGCGFQRTSHRYVKPCQGTG